MTSVISVENVSKFYKLGLIGGGTLRADFERWLASARHQPDPLLKIGEADHGNRSGEYIWALRDVSFNVQQGEVLGIIGRNGAGKSTLLKILSRVTAPTSGRIRVKGRIASLLEVGTGFHPELTGRENVFLNGSILGMKRKEIQKKFDEIVEFAEVSQFIDTPVKRYSSGMYVRLAFAVAAHLDPEILIVDEVLAVGDSAFQKKCLGKMGDVSKEGRTILFVSHNMASIKTLCPSAMVLQNGFARPIIETESAIEFYLASSKQATNRNFPVVRDELTIYSFNVHQNDKYLEEFDGDGPIELSIRFALSENTNLLRIGYFIRSAQGEIIATSLFDDWANEEIKFQKGSYLLQSCIPEGTLVAGRYRIELVCFRHKIKDYLAREEIFEEIMIAHPKNYNKLHLSEKNPGYFLINSRWDLNVL